jgi:hypothetical protein
MSLRHADSAVRLAEASGDPGVLSRALSHIAFTRQNAGEGLQRELLMRADALEREGSGRGRDDTPLQILGLQLSVVGDLAFATMSSHVLGFVALSLGDAEAAVRHLAPLRESEERLGIRDPAVFCVAPDLAEALVMTGDLEAAREVQAELEARGRELGRTWAVATGLRCRGLIAAAEGRPDVALAALTEAVELHAAVPQPFDRARTLLVLVCATAAMAVAPAGALARPAVDTFAKPGVEIQPTVIERSSTPVVRNSRTGGDMTLVLILSASALLLVAGGAGLAGRRHQRIRLLA